MPRVEPFELPFVHKDSLSTTLALQDYQAKHLGPDLADYHPLLLHCHAGVLLQSKDPILTLSDVRGKKIRGAGRATVWLLEALGATGIGMPLNDIPPALSKGVIDGVFLPFEIAPAVKMQDLVSHYSELSGEQPRFTTSVFTFLMNKQSYNKLSAEMKKVIDDHSGRNIAKWAGENWMEIEKPGREVVASKEKNKFHVISPAETAKMKDAAKPVFERWFAEMRTIGVDGPALLADARELIDKYSKRM
jgi:TRAP-type C4-dicarboxylate transport system substrate-binding protein